MLFARRAVNNFIFSPVKPSSSLYLVPHPMLYVGARCDRFGWSTYSTANTADYVLSDRISQTLPPVALVTFIVTACIFINSVITIQLSSHVICQNLQVNPIATVVKVVQRSKGSQNDPMVTRVPRNARWGSALYYPPHRFHRPHCLV